MWEGLFGFTNGLAVIGWLLLAFLPRKPLTHSAILYLGIGLLCLIYAVCFGLFLSGRVISAAEAHEIGLVDRITEPDDLIDEAVRVAASYAANPDLQLRMTKQLLTDNVVETDLALIQRREQEQLAACWASPEHAEAVAAFLAKRPPVFRPTTGA